MLEAGGLIDQLMEHIIQCKLLLIASCITLTEVNAIMRQNSLESKTKQNFHSQQRTSFPL